jgi:hypothetical protein
MLTFVRSIALALPLLFCTVAQASQAPEAPEAPKPMAGERPIWFGIGSGFSGTAPEEFVGAGVAFNFTVGLRFLPISPELILREGVAGLGTDGQRHIAGIGGGVRILFPRLLLARATARVAFAHQHELPWDEYTASIGSAVKSSFGVHDDIGHRSGFEVGGGLELSAPGFPLGFYTQVTAIVLPGTAGPPVTLQTELGLSIAVGKPIQ